MCETKFHAPYTTSKSQITMSIKKLFNNFSSYLSSKKNNKENMVHTNDIPTSFIECFKLKHNYKEIINAQDFGYTIEVKRNSDLNERERKYITDFLNQDDNKDIFLFDNKLTLDEKGYSLFFTRNNEVVAYIQVMEDDDSSMGVTINYLSVKKELRRKGIAIHLLAQTIHFCNNTYPERDIFAWIDVKLDELFSGFGFSPFIGQIEEVNERLISLFAFKWELQEMA